MASGVFQLRARRAPARICPAGGLRTARACAVMVERGAVGRLCGCKLFAVERTERIHCRMELERGFSLLAHDDTDSIAADLDDVGL